MTDHVVATQEVLEAAALERAGLRMACEELAEFRAWRGAPLTPATSEEVDAVVREMREKAKGTME